MMAKARISPHMRNYGTRMNIHGSKMTSAPPDKEALRMIAIVDEYVKHDAEGELCTIIHHTGQVCRRIEGHS